MRWFGRPTAVVSIWSDDARSGRLPPICAGTGRPATERKLFRSTSLPFVAWLLILLLPCWLIAGVPFFPAEGPIRLPVSADWNRRLRIVSAMALALIPLTLGLVVAAIAVPDSDAILWPAAVLSFGASLILSAARQSWQPRMSHGHRETADGPEYIELGNVHPAFAAAVVARYGQGTTPQA